MLFQTPVFSVFPCEMIVYSHSAELTRASERAANRDDRADSTTVLPVHSCQSVECHSCGLQRNFDLVKRPFVPCWSVAVSKLYCKTVFTTNIKYRILKAFTTVIRNVFLAENVHAHTSDVHRKEPWCITINQSHLKHLVFSLMAYSITTF